MADFAAGSEDTSTVNAANGNVSTEDVDMSDAIHRAQELLAKTQNLDTWPLLHNPIPKSEKR
jgi:hypothetical protein